MDIEPKSLGASLHKKNWFPFWVVLGCIGLAALTIKPSRLSQWLACLFVLAPAFWIGFRSPGIIGRWEYGSDPLLRGLIFALRIVFMLCVMWYAVPWSISVFDGVMRV